MLLRNDMPEIERLAEEVTLFLNQHGVPPETVGDLNLALEEVVANVIMHAYPQGGAHEIRVDVTAEVDRVAAAVVEMAWPSIRCNEPSQTLRFPWRNVPWADWGSFWPAGSWTTCTTRAKPEGTT